MKNKVKSVYSSNKKRGRNLNVGPSIPCIRQNISREEAIYINITVLSRNIESLRPNNWVISLGHFKTCKLKCKISSMEK